jgi:hypothetical protein
MHPAVYKVEPDFIVSEEDVWACEELGDRGLEEIA